MENEGGARLIMESSQASDLASLNLTGSKGLEPYSHNNDSEEKRGQGYGTTSECERAKARDEIRDEWLNLEVSYSEIRDLTDNFSESLVIGKGGFGKVYQAKLDGRTVAIKILDSTSTQGQREFFQEIEVLYKMRHPNLVKLVGACFEEVRALIYEYLPNGSLEDCLKDSPKTLTWQMRTRIIYEICLAISYLHSKSVIHADLKPANVLLDANFKSKLSDFGLCRFLPEDMATARYLETSPMGTPGYTDPWFLDRCILRPGSDLYSLGITVLKLLTGMPPVGLSWKIKQADKHSLPKMIDPTAGNWPSELAKEMAYWSLQCCYHNEDSSKVLMDMSTRLLGMLDEIETLQGGKFKPEQTIRYGSGGLEQSSHNKDKEVMGATNPPSSSSSFSEPHPPTQDGLSAPKSTTLKIDTQPQPPTQDGLSAPEPPTPRVDTQISSGSINSTFAMLSVTMNLLCNEYQQALQQKIRVPKLFLGGVGVHKTGTEIAIALNNIDARAEYVLKLKHEIEEQCAQVSPAPVDREKVKSCLTELGEMNAGFKQMLIGGMEQLAATVIPRIRPVLDTVATISYELSDAENEVNDPWVQKLLHAVETNMAWLQPSMTSNNYDLFVHLVIDFIVKRLEVIMMQKRFSQLGGLQLDREVRALVNHFSEMSQRPVRDKFARLTQMTTILNFERVSEILDFWGENAGRMTWLLTPSEVRRVLGLRIDFKPEAISALRL